MRLIQTFYSIPFFNLIFWNYCYTIQLWQNSQCSNNATTLCFQLLKSNTSFSFITFLSLLTDGHSARAALVSTSVRGFTGCQPAAWFCWTRSSCSAYCRTNLNVRQFAGLSAGVAPAARLSFKVASPSAEECQAIIPRRQRGGFVLLITKLHTQSIFMVEPDTASVKKNRTVFFL